MPLRAEWCRPVFPTSLVNSVRQPTRAAYLTLRIYSFCLQEDSVQVSQPKLAKPRACLQDFFELGIVPADTDYRMFSAKLKGRLPGIDTAFLLGAGMYHTDRDCYDNLRPGTLQVGSRCREKE